LGDRLLKKITPNSNLTMMSVVGMYFARGMNGKERVVMGY